MSKISRDPADLVAQAIGANHQYPDGFVLFLGTMFAPVEGSRRAGRGLHAPSDDRVVIATARLGALENRVTTSDRAPPWTFGVGELVRNLAARGLLRIELTTGRPHGRPAPQLHRRRMDRRRRHLARTSIRPT